MFDVITAFDASLMGWLRSVHTPSLDWGMAWLSAGPGAGLVWLTLAVIAFVRPSDRAAAWRVLLGVALAYSLVDGVLKPTIDRPRPPRSITANETRSLPDVPSSASFPSGHATASFSAVVTVSQMWPATTLVWWALAVLIGYARIYVAHHYPLDIVAGALLGLAIGYWVTGGVGRAAVRSDAK